MTTITAPTAATTALTATGAAASVAPANVGPSIGDQFLTLLVGPRGLADAIREQPHQARLNIGDTAKHLVELVFAKSRQPGCRGRPHSGREMRHARERQHSGDAAGGSHINAIA